MRAKKLGKTLNSPQIQALVRSLREVDNCTNLRWLSLDYASIVTVAATAMAFVLQREKWGVAWAWNVPVCGLAIVLLGALQHRLAGLGHEAAHYTLLKNRRWNELVGDWFCMFPLFATTHQYRIVHLAHHQYTNEWNRDPDLVDIGVSKMMDRFPMSRARFVYNFYVRFLAPHVLLRYFWDVFYLSVLGGGNSPYLDESKYHSSTESERQPARSKIRLTSVAGAVYFFGLVATLASINARGGGVWLYIAPAAALAGALAVIAALPKSAFVDAPLKCVYSARATSALRITYFTGLLTCCAWLRSWTGINLGGFYLLLWVLPLCTTFAYFMLLRDVYQHANADDGKLTNTRVFFSDPFTTWAVWVYGMDMHVPHHMYPAIPHYRLRQLHELLVQNNREYADHVVECHGTFSNRNGKPTILDVMQIPTTESSGAREFPRERESVSQTVGSIG